MKIYIKSNTSNNVQLQTGDIVEITDAYVKNDNGLYFVSNSPGDPNWTGRDWCLHKINKSGKISTTKYSTCFWPLNYKLNYTWKRSYTQEENDPQIQFRPDINTGYIKQYFIDLADDFAEQAKQYEMRGYSEKLINDCTVCADYYYDVANSL